MSSVWFFQCHHVSSEHGDLRCGRHIPTEQTAELPAHRPPPGKPVVPLAEWQGHGLGRVFFLGRERASGASSKLHDPEARRVLLPQTHLSHVSQSGGCSVSIHAGSELRSHAIPAAGALQPHNLGKEMG